MSYPGALQIQFRHHLGQDPIPAAAGAQMIYCLLECTPLSEGGAGLHQPLNICLVLDQSLSMRGEKLERVGEAARHVFSQLGPRDAFAIVAFNDRASVVLPAQVGVAPGAVTRAIESIVPRGGTELAAGLQAGLEELLRGRSQVGRGISSLIVLTDGRTYGDEGRCLELAELARRQDLLITPLGVGDEWNEDLLETIAYRCGSHSEYIDQPAAIVEAFRQHVADLRKICGRQAELTVRTEAGSRLAQIHRVSPLIGRLEQLPGPNASTQSFALGALMAGETQGLLLEVVLAEAVAGTVEIADCTLEWQPVTAGQPGSSAGYRVAAAAGPNSGRAAPIAPAVQTAVEKVVAYRLQKRAWQDLQEGNVAQATSKLRMVATRLLAAGEPELAQTVEAEVRRLARDGFSSGPGTKQIKYGTRGLGRTRSMRAPEETGQRAPYGRGAL